MSPQPLSLVHEIVPPSQPSPGQAPPLLLLLHGVRSNERDLLGLAPHLDGRFCIISVRAPLTLGPGQYGWYPVQFTPEGPTNDPAVSEQGWQSVQQFIREATAAYGLDAARVTLMGFSQGAIMSLGASLTQPELVAGVVAMSGRLLPEVVPQIASPERLTGKPFLVVHGVHDTVLPVAFGRGIRDHLAALPVALTYREYPMAHEVSPASLADIAHWLTERLDG